MNIDIKATNLELTTPLREYVESKVGALEKFLGTFDPDSIRAQVEVARTTKQQSGEIFYAEVNLTFPRGNLRATHTSHDIKVSVDKVKDVLQREIRKYKDKHF